MFKLGKFFRELLAELFVQGKMLVGYLLVANPWLTDYPTLVSALQDFVANPSKETAALAVAQAILALGASHRIVKILVAVLGKLAK